MVYWVKPLGHTAFDRCPESISSREWLHVHFRDDNTLCSGWSFNCRSVDDRRQYRDRRLSGVSCLRNGVSAVRSLGRLVLSRTSRLGVCSQIESEDDVDRVTGLEPVYLT